MQEGRWKGMERSDKVSRMREVRKCRNERKTRMVWKGGRERGGEIVTGGERKELRLARKRG